MNTAQQAVTPSQAAADEAWLVVVAAAAGAERAEASGQSMSYALDDDAALAEVPADDADSVLRWCPGSGWTARLAEDDPRLPLIDLYLPVCSATRVRPITVGHLGQSLDGFIATHGGDSQFVTGRENLLHMHRLRALCDAIIVGAGTVAADDPQLTTRHVPGPSPLRVIFDPTRGLEHHYRVFSDGSAETLYVCGRSLTTPEESHFGKARLVAVDDHEEGVDVADVVRLLHHRGCSRIFIEGGGVTVSTFLEANLLDRLQIAIAPLIIGDGRPAIRLEAPDLLSQCQRPRCRVFRMGGDVLFDCDLRSTNDDQARSDIVSRVI